jgi:hypothetical protein
VVGQRRAFGEGEFLIEFRVDLAEPRSVIGHCQRRSSFTS